MRTQFSIECFGENHSKTFFCKDKISLLQLFGEDQGVLNVSKANHYAKATLRAFSVAINWFMLGSYNNRLVVTYCFVSVSWQTRFLFLTVVIHLAAQYRDQMSAT